MPTHPTICSSKQGLTRPDQSKVDAVDDDWDKFESFAHYDAFTRAWLQAARRMLKPDGAIWVIGCYHNIFRVGTALQDLDFWMLNDVIWRKANPMPNFRGTRFTNAHETLIWAARDKKSRVTFNYEAMKQANDDTQMRSRLAVPDLHRRRAAEGRGRRQGASDAEAGSRCCSASSMRRPSRATWCSTRSSAPARRAPWPRSSGRHFIGIEREDTYIAAALKRIAAIKPLSAEAIETAVPKRAAPRVAFGSLVEMGLIAPGTELFDDAPALVARWCGPTARWLRARIRARSTGSARWFRAPRPATAGPSGTPTPSGRLAPIDILRGEIRAQMEQLSA